MTATKDQLLLALLDAGAVIKGAAVHCPFHSDKRPSGGVYEKDGHWRFKCHSCGFCGDVYDVLARIKEVPVADMLQQCNGNAPAKPKYKTIDDIKKSYDNYEGFYAYTNPATGIADLIVVRYRIDNRKSFAIYRPVADGYSSGAPPKPWPIYNRTRVAAANEVVVVEGEKCVHALHSAGVVATTKPGGAQGAEDADWSLLRGKTVFLWPDNDDKGIAYMQRVKAAIESFCDTCWIEPGELGLAAKGDAADLVAALKPDRREFVIKEILDSVRPQTPAAGVIDVLDKTISGEIRAIPFPWYELSHTSKALLPKTVTLICGAAGGGKSYFMTEATVCWYEQGVRWAVYDLEEDRTHRLLRALSQKVRNAGLADDDWIRDNADEVRNIYQENSDWLDDFGKHIWAAPDKSLSLDMILDWIEGRAKEGYRLVIIDPITSAARSAKSTWEADENFLFSAKALARRYKISLILVTHPKKGAKQAIGIDVLAGGAAYARFTHTVIWVEHVHPPKEVTCYSGCGTSPVEINRKIHIAKARNGPGHGAVYGFTFDQQDLRFIEHGCIVHDKKGDA